MYTKKIIDKCVTYLKDDQREIINKCKECIGSTKECHDEIHYNVTDKEYSCSDSMAEYVAKYFPRYVTEVRDTLDVIKFPWDKEKEIGILSIGNGPSSDLYAFLDDRGEEKSKIIYHGIDMNPNWDYINKITEEDILTLDSNCEVKFKTGDVFEEIKKFNCPEDKVWACNFLVFQYVISAMANDPDATKEDIEKFLDKVVYQIIAKMPENSYIIFNDINHNTKARDYFEYLRIKIREVCEFGYWTRHYPYSSYDYGYCHKHNNIHEEYENEFDERGYCSSAQLIIEKGANK